MHKSNFESNAWLTGLVNADGNIQISLQANYKLNKTLSILGKGESKMCILNKQRATDKPTGNFCVPFMIKTAYLFKCKVRRIKWNYFISASIQ